MVDFFSDAGLMTVEPKYSSDGFFILITWWVEHKFFFFFFIVKYFIDQIKNGKSTSLLLKLLLMHEQL